MLHTNGTRPFPWVGPVPWICLPIIHFSNNIQEVLDNELSPYLHLQTLAPLFPLVSTQAWDRVGSFSGTAFSHSLGPKGSGDPSVFYRGPQCPRQHLTQRSCPWRPGCAGNHSTSFEFQISLDGNGTLPCDQPHTLLITHSCTGRWKGVCHHRVSMGFGTQGHSIKPKGQTSPLRNEATNFEGNLSVWAWNS